MPENGNRSRKRQMSIADHRKRIKTSMLVNRLADHVDGKVQLSSTQVTAALGLLRKALPDMTEHEIKQLTEVSGEIKISWLK